MTKKKVVFLTGTRADFGKLKSLISILQGLPDYDVHIFATGMHLNSKYGKTVDEIIKSGFRNIYQYINHDTVEHMDRTLATTINGFSHYVAETAPDLIVVHGDRVEALAGAIVGSLNNILVSHVEGGEISGTIDESIRHAVSKMAHVHFVANRIAKRRLIQLGERVETIFVIGSPDLDLMNPLTLPDELQVKQYYGIYFEDYAIAMFHPVTTEYQSIQSYAQEFVSALIESGRNYVVIYPNNDLGSIEILNEYKRLNNHPRFKIFPSLRFEYFLTLLKSANFIVGNSSAGVREAPYYNVITIDIGTRQNNRVSMTSVLHVGYQKNEIIAAIKKINHYRADKPVQHNCEFGVGNSDQLFVEVLESGQVWHMDRQKQFQELLR